LKAIQPSNKKPWKNPLKLEDLRASLHYIIQRIETNARRHTMHKPTPKAVGESSATKKLLRAIKHP